MTNIQEQETPGTVADIRPVRGLRRTAFLLAGLSFLVLGVLGTFLPVLPGTPFILLASYCFLRSAPRLHERLLRSRLFGPMLRDWHRHRAVRPSVKLTAVTVLLLAAGSSALFADLALPLLILLGVLTLIGLVVVLRLPVVRSHEGLTGTKKTEGTGEG